jgi:hypothetical protein
VAGGGSFHDGTLLGAVTRYAPGWIRRRGEPVPLGSTLAFVVTIDVTLVAISVIAALQRPIADLPASVATAIFLFATSTPIIADFAPLLLVLMVGVSDP